MHAAACARAAELAVRALDLDRAATLTQELRTRAVTTQAPQALFDAELLTARLCIARGQLDASAQPCAEARRLAESHLAPDAVARGDGLHGQGLAATGQTSEARRCLQRAAEGPDAHSRAIALVGLGMLEAQTGNFASAANLHDRALTATRDLGDRAFHRDGPRARHEPEREGRDCRVRRRVRAVAAPFRDSVIHDVPSAPVSVKQNISSSSVELPVRK